MKGIIKDPIPLVELDPKWINHGERKGVGIRFRSPLGRGYIRFLFENPLDGGPSLPNDDAIPSNNDGERWTRVGDSFETLTITPSIDEGEQGWHGHVTKGAVQ